MVDRPSILFEMARVEQEYLRLPALDGGLDIMWVYGYAGDIEISGALQQELET